jgi:hypothetical protein
MLKISDIIAKFRTVAWANLLKQCFLNEGNMYTYGNMFSLIRRIRNVKGDK